MDRKAGWEAPSKPTCWVSFKSARRSPGGGRAKWATTGVVSSFTEGGRCFYRGVGGFSRRIKGWARERKVSAGGNRGFAGGKLFPQGSGGFVLRSKMSPLMSGKVLPAGVVFPLAGVGFSLVGEDIFPAGGDCFPAGEDFFLAGGDIFPAGKEVLSGSGGAARGKRGASGFGRGGPAFGARWAPRRARRSATVIDRRSRSGWPETP